MEQVFGCSSSAETYSNGVNLFDTDRPPFAAVGGGSVGTAVIEPDRLTLVERYGGASVFDHEIREMPDAAPSLEHLAVVMKMMGIFYAR